VIPAIVSLMALAAAAYQALALAAAVRHLRKKEASPAALPPLSILKPVKGRDPHFYEAIRSQAAQEYPEFEMLFGVSDPADPAVADIERLAREFPGRPVRVVRCSSRAPNRKVGVLMDLAAEARHPLLVVSDSDIRVPPGYLKRIVAELEQPGVGVVTCLYGAVADHWPGRWEGIGIASDFAPSVLVAPWTGVREFGLGSTLCFRAVDLERVGGFATIAGYLADDYQLAKRITGLGLRAVLSKITVETQLGGRTWGEIWRHQVRWARTIRVSRPGGYAGLPVTQASVWAAALALLGYGWAAGGLLALRLLAGVTVGIAVLSNSAVRLHWYLIPLRDLWGAAVWIAGLFGNTVVWRGQRLRLTRDGRILVDETPAGQLE